MIRSKIISRLSIIILTVLMIIPNTRFYGLFIFGLCFIIVAMINLIQRIYFDISLKDSVSATLIELREYNDSDGGKSYTPIYQYMYKDVENKYPSPASMFWYKRTMSIGDEVIIEIIPNKPSIRRIKKTSYTYLEYLACVVVFTIGIVVCVIAIHDLFFI